LAGSQAGKVGVSTYGYDPNGNITSILHKTGAGSQLASYVYTYDQVDRLASATDNGVSTGYQYDKDGQLLQDGSKNYTYDANGNRTITGYVTGSNNELLSDGTWAYYYDAEDNLTLKTNYSTAETWAYGYDLNNHLVAAVHQDRTGAVLASVTIKYDVFGNRVEEDTTVSGTTTGQRFAYVGSNVWADLSSTNALQTRRLYMDGADDLVAHISAAGVAAWYLSDHLGSTTPERRSIRWLMTLSGM
jgi:YD repeat-containing protein